MKIKTKGTTLGDVTKAARLITLPDLYLRLKKVLDDPDYTMAEVAVVISHDPSITLRLLRLVNSSLYGFARKIETVSHAVALLGTQQVHDLILATSIARAFKGISNDVIDMRQFWQNSVFCAVASRQLATQCNDCDKERLFVAGLLHDIGHLVMYQAIPELSQQAILTSQQKDEPIYKVERELLGFDYADIGAELMVQWALPNSLWETTLLHVEPNKADKYALETSLVHLGSMLAMANKEKGVLNEGKLTIAPSVWDVSELSLVDCINLNDQIEMDAQEAMSYIYPRAKAA